MPNGPELEMDDINHRCCHCGTIKNNLKCLRYFMSSLFFCFNGIGFSFYKWENRKGFWIVRKVILFDYVRNDVSTVDWAKNQESANVLVNFLRHKNLLLKLSLLDDNGFKDCAAEWKREDSASNRVCSS
ncbi:hypothetical protein CEXT_527121 [Caerostris extrusa]|uniref:Uncharacterized protein n=1 Tax=Caerostris extrusa TaxID=172846 RepID=A0AAV4XHI1_CAEEX|nr:hypothetical protein CEXT_527121 [Caerostris extrusa]